MLSVTANDRPRPQCHAGRIRHQAARLGLQAPAARVDGTAAAAGAAAGAASAAGSTAGTAAPADAKTVRKTRRRLSVVSDNKVIDGLASLDVSGEADAGALSSVAASEGKKRCVSVFTGVSKKGYAPYSALI